MPVAGKIFSVIIILAIIAMVLLPLYLWVHASFQAENPGDESGETANSGLVFGKIEGIWGLIGLTFLYAIPTSLIAAFLHTLLAFGLAYGLARGNFPIREEARLICFLALFIPATVIIGPLYRINNSLGIHGHFVAVFLALWTVPWLTILLYQYLSRLPERMELYGAADGMSNKQIFTNLILPYSYKGLITVFLIAFLASYHSLFAAAAAMPSEYFTDKLSPSFSYLPVMMYFFRQPADSIQLSAKLLIALIFQIPSLIALPPILYFGLPMLRTILTGRFRVRITSNFK